MINEAICIVCIVRDFIPVYKLYGMLLDRRLSDNWRRNCYRLTCTGSNSTAKKHCCLALTIHKHNSSFSILLKYVGSFH